VIGRVRGLRKWMMERPKFGDHRASCLENELRLAFQTDMESRGIAKERDRADVRRTYRTGPLDCCHL
jgi:hypothetical protein